MENKTFEQLLSEVLADAREKILNAKGGDSLTVTTGVSYVDRNLGEHKEFIAGTTNAIFASLTAYVKGKETEEDHAYGYTMMIDLEKKDAQPMEQFESERDEFVADIDRFTALLTECDDVAALIKRESDAADAEAKALMDKFNADMKKIKIATRIGIGVAIALGIFVVIMSNLFK